MHASRWRILLAAFLVFASAGLSAGQTPRPSAMKLFPAETLIFARAAHIGELRERFRLSAGGRMLNDPQISPLVQDIFQMSKEQFDTNVSEEAGFDSTDLDKLPAGEAAFAMIDVGGTEPAVMFLLDFGDNAETAPELLDRLLAKGESNGATILRETRGNDEVTIIRGPNDGADDGVGYILRDGCMLASNDQAMLDLARARWDQANVGTPLPEPVVDPEKPDAEPVGSRTLAENPNFVAIMRECGTQLAEPPQAMFFVDPLGIVKLIGRENGGVRIAIAMFPTLGVDQLLGFGGTLSLATSEWDSLIHLHVLLENPRSGVMNLLRFREGETLPPTFVPVAVADYGSFAVDPPWLYGEIAKLVDGFRYEGSFDESVTSSISRPLEVDFNTRILPLLTGRCAYVVGFRDPPELPAPHQRVIAIEVSDPVAARALLDELTEKHSDALHETEFAGVTSWTLGPERSADEADSGEAEGEPTRRERRRRAMQQMFDPAVTIIDSWVLVASSANLIEQCIAAQQGESERLADSLEYRLIESRITMMTGGRPLSILHFQKPEIGLKQWYDMLASGEINESLADAENSYMVGLREALERNELPPFEVFSQYMTPTGGFLLDTATGFHYMGFSVARQPDPETEPAATE